ncbi:hypothetical protein DP130_11520 [Clostridium tetani]|uniref:Uncharacterized protein n=1 Tax=Clostridium tetani TaxID=1513 RepID=A0A4Q0VB96_CLOTA|nr:hypothetical protein [Clostridium tetani]RXI46185.1 hypothetical protein DP130_11520 [Clostridium tetani]
MYVNNRKNFNNKKIITKEEILKIRHTINIEHLEKTPKEKANILSETIHSILEEHLIGIKNCNKKQIKISLLKNTIFNNKDNISYLDIYNTITSDTFKDIVSSEEISIWQNCIIKNNNRKNVFKLRHNKLILFFICTFFILILTHSYKKVSSYVFSNKVENVATINYDLLISKIENNNSTSLPSYFKYIEIDNEKLKTFLINRNSLLSEEPYFSSIINSAKEFNLNPLILFAITGQEQSFVPKTDKSSKKIANNPFNVFHSWMEYNTDIVDSSKIACRTVINLCEDRPQGEDPFQWINRKYAEDKNWHKGVRSIYNDLVNNLREN